MHLVDFKVRILEGCEGTAAKVRVLIDSSDGQRYLEHHRSFNKHHRSKLAGPCG